MEILQSRGSTIVWQHHKDFNETFLEKYRQKLYKDTVFDKSWKQHPTKQQQYSFLTVITYTIQVKQTRLARHLWRSREKRMIDILLWTPTYELTSENL